MICPHCGKPVPLRISPEAIKRAKEMRKEGYSLRDIEEMLKREGYSRISYTSIHRYLEKPEK